MATRSEVLDRYLAALPAHDWAALGDTISDQALHRVGPFGDVVEGKDRYVAFLSALLPTLRSYRLDVHDVHWLTSGDAVVELSEHLEVDGAVQRFPEAIFFGFDDADRIARVRIYLQQLGAAAPVPGGRAG